MRIGRKLWGPIVLALATAGLITVATGAVGEEEGEEKGPPPDAVLVVSGSRAASAAGLTLVEGTLQIRRRVYALRIEGLPPGEERFGEVYGLVTTRDIEGDYEPVLTGVRNEKGVTIVFDPPLARLEEPLRIELAGDGRGSRLWLRRRVGTPGARGFFLPRSFGAGERSFGPLSLQPTLDVQLAGFAHGNAGFGGEWSAGPIADSDVSFQHSNEVGLDARVDLERYGAVHGRVSGVFSLSGGGVDPGATSYPDINVSSYTIEAASLGWKSGNALQELGFDAVEMGYGNQSYQVFDGLLFWDGGTSCGGRGACWLAPRKAFREAGLLRLAIGEWTIDGIHLKLNDAPDTGTRLGGGRVEHAVKDRIVHEAKTGFMYFNVYDSDEPSRDGLNGFYLYQEATPFAPLEDFQYTASFVAQANSAAAGNSEAYGWYAAPAYTISALPWSPRLVYRFASFSGGGTRNFDPLFAGLSDWGTWFQGELLGEWVLPNTNLRSHMVRLTLEPDDVFTVNVIYYKFLLADREQEFGPEPARVASHQLADEVDLIVDIAGSNWWSMTVAVTVAVPNAGLREATGGSSTWIGSMLYTNLTF